MRTFIAFCLILSPIGASAHDTSGKASTRLIISERAVAAGIAATPPPPTPPPGDDSLKNGAIIGAIVGAAVFGGFVTFLCNALREPGNPSCLGSSMLGIGIGAGIGAAGGAGLDALTWRHPGPKVGLPPEPLRGR